MFFALLIGGIVLTAVCVLLAHLSRFGSAASIVCTTIAGVVGFLMLVLVVGAWPGTYIGSVDTVAQYHSLKTRLEVDRARGVDPFSGFGVEKSMYETNISIVSAQYWNTHGLDPLYTDDVMGLELLK